MDYGETKKMVTYEYEGKATILPNSFGEETWHRVTLLLGGGVYHAVYIPKEESNPLEAFFLFEEAGDVAKLQHCRVVERKQMVLERAMSQRSTCALAEAAFQLGLIDDRVRIAAPCCCTIAQRGEKGTWHLGME